MDAIIQQGQVDSAARAAAQAAHEDNRRQKRQNRRRVIRQERDARRLQRAGARLRRLHNFLKLDGDPETFTKTDAQAIADTYKASSQVTTQRRGALIERLLAEIPD